MSSIYSSLAAGVCSAPFCIPFHNGMINGAWTTDVNLNSFADSGYISRLLIRAIH